MMNKVTEGFGVNTVDLIVHPFVDFIVDPLVNPFFDLFVPPCFPSKEVLSS